MRGWWSLLLVASVAFGVARAPHRLRRAQPEATLSAQLSGIHHHARSHRTVAALPLVAQLPIVDVSPSEAATASLDEPPPADLVPPVARGPPVG
jgi:hypothetical protein